MKIASVVRLCLGFAAASTAAWANPCGQNTLASYIQLGPAGCTVGTSTFQDFTFGSTVLNGNPSVLNAALITVTPALTPAFGTLNFTSGGFTLSGLDAVQYNIGFTIDPPPPILHGYELDLLTNTPVFPGTADVTSSLCIGAAFLPGGCQAPSGSLTVFHHGSAGSSTTAFLGFSPTGIVGVQTVIVLDGHGTGSSSITGIATGSQIIPEPGTLLPAGLGIALFAYLARARRRASAELRQIALQFGAQR